MFFTQASFVNARYSFLNLFCTNKLNIRVCLLFPSIFLLLVLFAAVAAVAFYVASKLTTHPKSDASALHPIELAIAFHNAD